MPRCLCTCPNPSLVLIRDTLPFQALTQGRPRPTTKGNNSNLVSLLLYISKIPSSQATSLENVQQTHHQNSSPQSRHPIKRPRLLHLRIQILQSQRSECSSPVRKPLCKSRSPEIMEIVGYTRATSTRSRCRSGDRHSRTHQYETTTTCWRWAEYCPSIPAALRLSLCVLLPSRFGEFGSIC